MARCEDFPCCGHGPASTGGDGGGCPDERGRFRCVECGDTLSSSASSSICQPCRKDLAFMSDDDREYREDFEARQNLYG